MESPASVATSGSAPPVAVDAPASVSVSATRDAANRGDFSAFDKADNASREGKPLADVPVATKSGPPAEGVTRPAEVKPLSNRQQRANDAVRDAAERAVADAVRDRDAEIVRLRAQIAAPTTRAAAPAQPAAPATIPEYKRITALPGAPKLNDVDAQGNPLYESVEEHSAAMHLFVQQALTSERNAQTSHEEVAAVERARIDGFLERLEAAKTADPEFLNKLTPEVKALKPISGLARDQQGNITEPSGPLNVLWELVYDSPVLDQLLLHFSAKPEALRAFEQMPAAVQKLPARMRTSAHIRRIVQQFGALEASFGTPSTPAAPVAAAPAASTSTITSAPPPPPALSRSGSSTNTKASAIARGDFATFDKLEMQEQLARRGA